MMVFMSALLVYMKISDNRVEKKIDTIYSILDTNTTCEDIIPNK